MTTTEIISEPKVIIYAHRRAKECEERSVRLHKESVTKRMNHLYPGEDFWSEDGKQMDADADTLVWCNLHSYLTNIPDDKQLDTQYMVGTCVRHLSMSYGGMALRNSHPFKNLHYIYQQAAAMLAVRELAQEFM